MKYCIIWYIELHQYYQRAGFPVLSNQCVMSVIPCKESWSLLPTELMFEHEQWRTFEAHQHKNNHQYSTLGGTNIFTAGYLSVINLSSKDEILKRVNYSLCEEGLFTWFKLSEQRLVETTHCVDITQLSVRWHNMEIYRVFLEEKEGQRSIFLFHPWVLPV